MKKTSEEKNQLIVGISQFLGMFLRDFFTAFRRLDIRGEDDSWARALQLFIDLPYFVLRRGVETGVYLYSVHVHIVSIHMISFTK